MDKAYLLEIRFTQALNIITLKSYRNARKVCATFYDDGQLTAQETTKYIVTRLREQDISSGCYSNEDGSWSVQVFY